ncbi:phage tail protein [Tumebacillus sp. ITR2]|uniref:Phage tail protein n=1 Tax=Tumebacillus amylolyticus TaxID=2801339 RepID=A0ABS1J6T7_9BACL|nr:tail fiber protein [Tumebacillus amylolyticus]MBL0385895.1 phage tail protein [Tumebacillus amylolyticus]
MADAYIGEIRLFAGSFAPTGWEFCNGQQLSIQQYQALYTILGTTYGGDSRTYFNLPNLQGMAPMGQGAGPGLTPRQMGDQDGTSTVTLDVSTLPPHNHLPQALNARGMSNSPQGNYWAETVPSGPARTQVKLYGTTPNVTLNDQVMAPVGGNAQGAADPHNNMQPYLAINFIICTTDGQYPDFNN